ncbi:MAG: hypothetical protein ACR650_15125 [Methylocystis sp.]|jgi:hypothetical protein
MRHLWIASFLCAGTLAAKADPAINQVSHYQTPQLDVMAVVQMGSNTSIAPHQTSTINLLRTNQIGGDSTTVNATQTGAANLAITRQASPNNSLQLQQTGLVAVANAVQTGQANGATITQIATSSPFVASNQ